MKLSRAFFLFVAAAVLLTFTAADGLRRLSGTRAGTSAGLFTLPAKPVSWKSVPADRLSGVVNALQSGNAEQLSRYFDNYVDLTLPEKRLFSYSKTQAVMVLRDFFDNHRVKNFSIQVRGDGETSSYCIGTLQTNEGSFRTMLFIRQEGGFPLIKEINLAAR